MTQEPKNDALWTKTFLCLLALGTLTSTSFFMVNPIISKYATLLGSSLGVAGVVAGLFSLTALAARPLGAVLVDQLNKKYILSGATAVMGVAAMGYAISDNITLLILFRILHGAAFAVSGTATTAMIASIIPRSRLGEGIGYYGMGGIIATALGPNAGLFVANAFGYQVNFLSSGIAMLLAAFLMSRLPFMWTAPAQTPRKRIRLDDLISFQVLPLALLGGMFSFTNGIVSSFLVLVGEERGIGNIGLYFTVLAVCLFFVRPFTGKLADRKGLAFIVYPALVLVALESVLLSRATVLWVVLLAAVAKAFGQGAAQPSIQATCLKKLDPAKSGVAAATFFIGADVGQGVGPMIGGALSESFGYEGAFYFCAVLMALGFLGFALYQRREKRRDALTSAPAAEED